VNRITPGTKAWVEEVSGQPIIEVEPLLGGLSSSVHRCLGQDRTYVVVRHITDQQWLEREPGLIHSEATTLELLSGSAVPAPKLLGSDPAGGRLLMSYLDGEVRSDIAHIGAHSDTIADMAVSIAAVELPSNHDLKQWASWVPVDAEPPSWGDHALWTEAIEVFETRRPLAEPAGLLHRDLHPLNLLWDNDTIVGVVDWVNACIGHRYAELGHCRWNLTVLGAKTAADAFLGRYLQSGPGYDPYDPWWDIVPVLSFINWPPDTAAWTALGRRDITPAKVTSITETFLRSALEAL